MKKKFKGQGALEYLLLIGGAVLIAVIVIALLVGMGGQSRDTAQEQADKAQAATDVPQPSQIVGVTAEYSKCDPDDDSNISFSWRPLGEGGSHELIIENASGNRVLVGTVWESGTNNTINQLDLNPNKLNLDANVRLEGRTLCGDSYYLSIKTTKNNQSVVSQKYKFSWAR
jgi:hypothetical protein